MAYSTKKGSLPVLQYLTPAQLAIDPLYQRELDGRSLRLIDQMAREWDWGLCLPLVVAQRIDRSFYVIDGQHRLEAARKRGDIEQLPCVLLYPGDPADEAATFVALNQHRRPLTAFALWNGALCAGDDDAMALHAVMAPIGASFSGAAHPASLKPRQFNCVATVRKWHERHGDAATRVVLGTIVAAFPDVALQIAGSLFAGTAAVVLEHGDRFDAAVLVRVFGRHDQDGWLKRFRTRAANDGVGLQAASVATLLDEYRDAVLPVAPPALAAPTPTPPAASAPRGLIDLNRVPSAMEERAASWSRPGHAG